METEAAAGKIREKRMFGRKGGGRERNVTEKYVSPGKAVMKSCWESKR